MNQNVYYPWKTHAAITLFGGFVLLIGIYTLLNGISILNTLICIVVSVTFGIGLIQSIYCFWNRTIPGHWHRKTTSGKIYEPMSGDATFVHGCPCKEGFSTPK